MGEMRECVIKMSAATRLLSRIFINNTRTINFPVQSAGYKSAVSLCRVYPTSSLDYNKKIEIPESKELNFSGYIPIESVDISYSCSSGPGGQNVNKVNTKVDLRFHLETAQWLSDELKKKVFNKFKTSINKEGYLIVRSEKTRSQQLNLADALDKLRHMIHSAAYIKPPPSVEAVERHRRKHEGAVRERLRQKKDRSLIKQSRRAPDPDF